MLGYAVNIKIIETLKSVISISVIPIGYSIDTIITPISPLISVQTKNLQITEVFGDYFRNCFTFTYNFGWESRPTRDCMASLFGSLANFQISCHF